MADQTNCEYDLFVSHAKPEQTWVHGYLLPALGLPAGRLITPDGLRPGAPKVAEFERAIASSKYTVLVFSPAYLADEWANFGEQLASYASVASQRDRLVPLSLKPCPLPLHIDFRVRLDCTEEANWEREIARIRSLLSSPEPVKQPVLCPYPGMLPFSRENAEYFYGRDDEIKGIIHHLRHQSFLAVIGASGAGKSSLVNAGLLRELPKSSFFPEGYWFVRQVRPGAQPMRALAQVMGGRLAGPSESVDALVVANPPARRLLLIIDQFEEVFTQAGSEEQHRFIAAVQELRKAASAAVVIAMRAAFYQDLMNSDLWPVAPSERLELVTLRSEALREAIQKPASHVGVYLEPELLERLQSDAANEPGVLPLMQEAMVLLWDRIGRRLLTLKAYEELGRDGRNGLAVAIATKADATLVQLAPSQQAIARRVFLRLVQFGVGREDTRRQQLRSALRSLGDDPSDFNHVVDHLINNRLLISSGEQKGDNEKIDLAHEALIAGWPTLQGWLSERRTGEQVRRRLEEKSEEWVRLGKSDGGLLDAVELAEADRWLSGPDASDLGYSENVNDLAAASRIHARQARRLRRLSRALGPVLALVVITAAYGWLQKKTSVARELTASALGSLPQEPHLSLLLAMHAISATRLANVNVFVLPEAEDALHRAILTPSVQSVLPGHEQGVTSVVWSFDGKRLATASLDGTAKVWDTATGRELFTLRDHEGAVNSLAWCPDGKRLATASSDGTAKVWDAETGTALRTLPSSQGIPLTGVSWNSNGTRLATGDSEGNSQIWDPDSGKKLAEHKSVESEVEEGVGVEIVAWSPSDENRLATAGGQVAMVWDIKTREGVPLEGHRGGVLSLAWSPDGKELATGSADRSAIVWDAYSGDILRTLCCHKGPVTAVAWSSDGIHLATGGGGSANEFDNTAKLWDAARNLELLTLVGIATGVAVAPPHSGGPGARRIYTQRIYDERRRRRGMCVAWSPDGKQLATGGDDGTTKVWDVFSDELPALDSHEVGFDRTTWGVAWSQDGKRLATAHSLGNVTIWDATTGQGLFVLKSDRRRALSVAWSPDGSKLAIGGLDLKAKVWDVKSRRVLFELSGHKRDTTFVTWRPDGKVLATASLDETAKLWDAATGGALQTLSGHVGRVRTASWSPDGKWLATAGLDQTVRVWDATSGAQVLNWHAHTAEVYSVAWSPDGKELVTASEDQTAKVWGTSTGRLLVTLLGHEGTVHSAAWSPDGKRLVTASDDGTVRFWDAATGRQLRILFSLGGGLLQVAWSRDGKRLATASQDGVVRQYAMDIGVLMALARQRAKSNLTPDECKRYLHLNRCPPIP